MLKAAAAFVCVIALGTFLIINADTGDGTISINSDEHGTSKVKFPKATVEESKETGGESASRDDSEGFLTTKAPSQTARREHNNGDEGDSGALSAPDSERGRNNDQNKVGKSDSHGDRDSDGVSTPKPPTRRPDGRNNGGNVVGRSASHGDSDSAEVLSSKPSTSRSNRRNNGGNVAGRSASRGDSDSGEVSASNPPTRRPDRRNNGGNKGNEGNLTETIEVSPNRSVIPPLEAIIQSKPTCSFPPEIEGAMPPRIEGTEHEVGTSVTYSCNFGYVSRNSINHISKCIFNETAEKAEWTVPEVACIPRSCGDPGYLSNGRRIGNLFTFPNKVEYECDEGYKIRGLRTRYCQAGGDWSGRLPICEQIYCTVPPDPENGRVRYDSLEYGTELRYECNAGFVLKKHQPRFCSEDGSWSDDEPECAEARCEEPKSPEYGTVRFTGDLKAGSLATYSCNPDKKLYGAATTKCLITGQWTFDPPKCISFCNVLDVKSGQMGRMENRSISRWRVVPEFKKLSIGSQVDHNETLLLRCSEDFIPTDGSTIFENNLMEVTCNDGTWSKDFWCKGTSCLEDPPPVRNGEPRISSRKHDQSIWYACDSKRHTKVPGAIRCRFGTWTGYTPKCLDSPCSTKELNFPGLVKPTEERLSSDENFDIVCKNGFTKSSSAEKVTCIGGKWDVEENPCTDHRCNTNDLNYPGLEKPWPEVFDSFKSFDIICKQGFKKSTLDRVITCVEGKWNVMEDPCTKIRVEITCSIFSTDNGLNVSYTNANKPGSWATFSCPSRMKLTRDTRSYCQDDGVWSSPQPYCQEITCPRFSTDTGLSISYSNANKPGSWATFSCPIRMELTGGPSSYCQDDGNWSSPQPYCQVSEHDRSTSVIQPATDSINKQDKGSSGHPIEDCTCTYVHSSFFVRARAGNKVLQEGDTVRKGVTVYFECDADDRVLSWDNGLRLRGKVNMTCSRCQKWEKRDLPDCKFHQEGRPLILYDNKLKILPGGVAEIKAGETVQLRCVSTFDNPNWYFNGNSVRNQTKYNHNRVFYTDIDITGTDRYNGKYNCSVQSEYASRSGSTTLDLVVTVSEHLRTTPIPPPANFNQNKVSTESSNQPTEECTCSYDVSRNHVIPRIGHAVLLEGDTVRRGETVSFECKANTRVISWENGLRLYGKVNMTCNTCQKLGSRDLPDCEVYQKGEPLILYPDDLKILPGGVTEIKKGVLFRFLCFSDYEYPRWFFNGSPAPYQGYHMRNRRYYTFVDLTVTDELHSGKLNCSIENQSVLLRRSSVLDLQITEITCPMFSTDNGLSVRYENGNKTGSWATFSCPSYTTLVGTAFSLCQNNGTWSLPQPYCQDYVSCSRFPESPGLVVSYSEGVSVGSNASFSCSPPNTLFGSSYAICQDNGSWNHPLPKCEEVTCYIFSTDNGLSVTYDNYNRRGSWATFSCSGNKRLTGEIRSRCKNDGTWSNPKPQCKDITCPTFSTGNGLSVRYDNFNRTGSWATFRCPVHMRMVGTGNSRCESDGTWSSPKPQCAEITCPMFVTGNSLSVRYDNSNKRGSWATFSCPVKTKLIGAAVSRCQNDGTWDRPEPYCEGANCSIADLATSVPEDVIPDMTGVTGEFVPFGSEMSLECENNLIPNGNSKALCKNNGEWELGSFQCVPGCVLKIDPSSHLKIHEVKDSYRLGEFILLSCPPGEKITSDVERLMCLGKTWSDNIPDCKKVEESSSRGPS